MDLLNKIIVSDVINTITVSSPKGRFEKIRNRKYYGLSFCTEGQITYTHNGKKYVSHSGNAIILPKGQTYTLYGDKKGVFPVINFDCIGKLCDTFIPLPTSDSEVFINDCEQIKSLLLIDGNHARVMSIFYDMLHRLFSHSTTNSIIQPALKYIEENYQNPHLTNEVLARECKISEVYLRKLFVEQLKTSPKQFIIDIRIQKAKQLLSEGALKINAVSDNCGFSNPYHFCRIFKSKTGLTPTEYMKQNKVYKI